MGQFTYCSDANCEGFFSTMEFYPPPLNSKHFKANGRNYVNPLNYPFYQRSCGYSRPSIPYPYPVAQYLNDATPRINGSRYPTSHGMVIEKQTIVTHDKLNERVFKFSKEDVDAVLYGYLRDEQNTLLHSLSSVQKAKDSSIDTFPTKAKHSQVFHAEVPPNLAINEVTLENVSHRGIFTKEHISKGTLLGPYTGRIKTIHEVGERKCNCSYSWEVFSEGRLQHFIDGSLEPKNWMKYINCARYATEQNLALIQSKDELYYKAIRDIEADQELLVWYSHEYVEYMGIPLFLRESVHQPEEKEKKKDVETPSGSFPCKRCGKIFSYEYYREKHLKYTRCVDMGDRKFPCHLCQRSFEKKDRLRIHILHVHQKYRPHVCKTCGKRFSQSSSLNKHCRVHTGERPYSCPHCPKSFTASSILRTHLRQHNGERPFKCKFCGKAFASHAAHDSHVRRTHDQHKKYACKICKKSFPMELELKFHLSAHTLEELDMLTKTGISPFPFDDSTKVTQNRMHADENNNKNIGNL